MTRARADLASAGSTRRDRTCVLRHLVRSCDPVLPAARPPIAGACLLAGLEEWAGLDSNQGPTDYEQASSSSLVFCFSHEFSVYGKWGRALCVNLGGPWLSSLFVEHGLTRKGAKYTASGCVGKASGLPGAVRGRAAEPRGRDRLLRRRLGGGSFLGGREDLVADDEAMLHFENAADIHREENLAQSGPPGSSS